MTNSERERFDELWTSHAGSIYGFAARRVGRDGADEVVADVFAVAWRRISEVPDPALPWLYGVGRNVIRQRHRSETRRARLHDALTMSPDTATRTGFDEVSAVTHALLRLEEGDQEVLRLVAWEELAPNEAAQVLGITSASFRMRLSRARRRLRTLLAEQEVVGYEN